MKKAETVLGPMLKQLGIESGVKLQRIKNDWHIIFDRSISSHMFPAVLNEGELLINVESPAWMQQLSYFKKDLIGKLSSYGVSGIRLRLGSISKVKKSSEEKPRLRPLTEDEASFISSAVADLTDEALKTSIKKAIEKSFVTDKTGGRKSF